MDSRVIIIGSGPAGISLAIELEKKKSSLQYWKQASLIIVRSQKFYKTEVIGDHLVDAIGYTRLRCLVEPRFGREGLVEHLMIMIFKLANFKKGFRSIYK